MVQGWALWHVRRHRSCQAASEKEAQLQGKAAAKGGQAAFQHAVGLIRLLDILRLLVVGRLLWIPSIPPRLLGIASISTISLQGYSNLKCIPLGPW